LNPARWILWAEIFWIWISHILIDPNLGKEIITRFIHLLQIDSIMPSVFAGGFHPQERDDRPTDRICVGHGAAKEH
jgi:hypothetical protein